MKKFDYLAALKIPALIILAMQGVGLIISVFMYSQITSYDQISTFGVMQTVSAIFGCIIFLGNLALFTYAGWIIVSKYEGTIINSTIGGLILSGLLFVIGMSGNILLYVVFPGFRITITGGFAGSGISELPEAALIGMFIGLLCGSAVVFIYGTGLAALGGFIASRRKKTSVPANPNTPISPVSNDVSKKENEVEVNEENKDEIRVE